MKQRERVYLTTAEHDLAERIGKTRNYIKRNLDVSDQKIDAGDDSLSVDVHGAMAEIAVAKWLGKDIDVLRSRLDALPAGVYPPHFIAAPDTEMRIQAPLTKHFMGHLIFRDVHEFVCDYAVLCIKTKPSLREGVLLAGWIDRETFCERHEMKNFGYNDVCAMSQVDLRPMVELRRELGLATDDEWPALQPALL